MKTRYEDLIQQNLQLKQKLTDIESKLQELETRVFREESDTCFILDELTQVDQLIHEVKTKANSSIVFVNDKAETISPCLTNCTRTFASANVIPSMPFETTKRNGTIVFVVGKIWRGLPSSGQIS